MALQITYNLAGDFPVMAYVRIKSVIVEYNPSVAITLGATKYTRKIVLEVKSAKNKNSIDTWSSDTWIFGYDHTISKDAISQAYQYLKTLPGFVSVIDVTD